MAVPSSWLLTRYSVVKPVAREKSTELKGPVRPVYSMSSVVRLVKNSRESGNAPAEH